MGKPQHPMSGNSPLVQGNIQALPGKMFSPYGAVAADAGMTTEMPATDTALSMLGTPLTTNAQQQHLALQRAIRGR